jgi:O-antigen/teichoic acid export membrane protein
MTFARNSALSAIAGVSTTVGGFLSSIVVARLLGVEGMGVFAFSVWLVMVAVMLADVGVPGCLTRYLPELHARGEYRAAEELTGLMLRRFFIALLVVVLGFFVYAAWLVDSSGGYGWEITAANYRVAPLFWTLVGISCLAQALAACLYGYLKGAQDFAMQARLAVASMAFQLVTTLVGALTLGITGALLGAIAGSVVPAIFIGRIVATGKTVNAELRRRATRFAWESWGSYLVTAFAWSRMEIFFLERSWGSHAVGLFTVGLTMANIASRGPLLLTGALLPYLSHQQGVGDKQKAHEAYATAMRLIASLVFPACLGAAAIAPALMPALYGQDFAASVPSTIVLVSAAALSAIASVTFTYMFAMERTRFVFAIGCIGAVLCIVSGLTLVPAFGAIAAASARAAIQALVAAASVWYVSRRLECPAPIASLGRLMLAALLCAAAARLCIDALPAPLSLFAAIPAGALSYVAAVRLLRALPANDLDRLINAVAILPRPSHRMVRALIRLLSPQTRAVSQSPTPG